MDWKVKWKRDVTGPGGWGMSTGWEVNNQTTDLSWWEPASRESIGKEVITGMGQTTGVTVNRWMQNWKGTKTLHTVFPGDDIKGNG